MAADHDYEPCTATAKQTGKRCRLRPAPGALTCRFHGGWAPQVRAAAQRRLQAEAAGRLVRTFGDPVAGIDPQDALLEMVAASAGHVRWLAEMVARLAPEAVAWGTAEQEQQEALGGDQVDEDGAVTRVRRYGADEYLRVKQTAAPNVWVALYGDWMDRHVRICKAAIAAGLGERQVRLAEEQGAIMARLLLAVAEDAELALSEAQQEAYRRVAARQLRLLPGRNEDTSNTSLVGT